MAERFTHWIQAGAGAAKVGFLTTDIYQSIGTEVGVTKLGGTDKVDSLVRIGDAIRQGQLIRLRIRYTAGTGTKSSTIVCDIDKVASAVGGLVTKSFKAGEIRSVSIMRRRRRG